MYDSAPLANPVAFRASFRAVPFRAADMEVLT
jgi:hypothetical protein